MSTSTPNLIQDLHTAMAAFQTGGSAKVSLCLSICIIKLIAALQAVKSSLKRLQEAGIELKLSRGQKELLAQALQRDKQRGRSARAAKSLATRTEDSTAQAQQRDQGHTAEAAEAADEVPSQPEGVEQPTEDPLMELGRAMLPARWAREDRGWDKAADQRSEMEEQRQAASRRAEVTERRWAKERAGAMNAMEVDPLEQSMVMAARKVKGKQAQELSDHEAEADPPPARSVPRRRTEEQEQAALAAEARALSRFVGQASNSTTERQLPSFQEPQCPVQPQVMALPLRSAVLNPAPTRDGISGMQIEVSPLVMHRYPAKHTDGFHRRTSPRCRAAALFPWPTSRWT